MPFISSCAYLLSCTLLGQKRPHGCIEFCVLNSVNNILNANTKHAESVVHSLLQHMKLPLLEFRIHGDGSAEFVEVQLDWNDVFITQLGCIYLLQGKESSNVIMTTWSNAAKMGPEEWYNHAA